MTLCELLTVLKHEKGEHYEVYINRSWELPTWNGEFLSDTVEAWINGFMYGTVSWEDYPFDNLKELHEWEMEVLFSEAGLIEEEGPYEEPAGHWINVDH